MKTLKKYKIKAELRDTSNIKKEGKESSLVIKQPRRTKSYFILTCLIGITLVLIYLGFL